MPKPQKPITISEEDLKNIDSIRDSVSKLSAQYEEIRRKGIAITYDEKRRKTFLEKKIARQKQYLSLLENETQKVQEISDRTEKFNKFLKKQVDTLGSAETVYDSIAEKIGKGSEGAQILAKHLANQKNILNVISSLGSEIAGTDIDKQKVLQKVLSDYKKYESSVANTVQHVSEGTLSQEKANAAIAKSKAAYMESIQSLTEMGEKGKDLLQLFIALVENTEKLGSVSAKTAKEFNIMEESVKKLGGHIPLINELSEAIKKGAKGGNAFKVAMFALGAAVGALAGKYFLAFPQAQMKATNDILQNQIETVRDIAKIRFEADMGPGKTNFLEQKKNLEIQRLGVDTEFNLAKAVKKTQDLQLKGTTEYRRILQGVNVEIAQNVNQFNAASKTALFGKGIGSVGYAKSQLAAAGVSAEDVANNIKQAGVVMGRMPSGEIAATMALMEKRTGASSESIAQINKSFVRLDGLSETSALNMQQGMTQLAEGSKIPLDNLMQEVASSSKEMLGYGIKNTSNLVKQVAAVQSMGVSLETIANAGKSMVLNYKDSIKAEMQLSSLLGQQVDLSEARAAFATGDYKGGVSAIQAQGLDVKNMNMFQLEALSQALGGMNIESITSMLTGQMTQPGELTAASATAGGKQFAAAKLAEKTQISMGGAIISAKDSEVQIQFDREIQEQILNSPFYKEYQQNQANLNVRTKLFESTMYQAWLNTDAYAKSVAELAQLDVKRTFTEGLIPGISGAIGGAIFTALAGPGLGKIFGGLGNLFKFGSSGTSGQNSSSGTSGSSGPNTLGGNKSSLPGTSGVGGFLSNLGAGIGNLLKYVGAGAGQAIGGFFRGMGSGLLAFAQMMAAPTPLFGLPAGLIVVGLAMGIAKALDIAAPGIKALTPLLLGLASIVGDTFVKALQAAGPVITSIFNGIGNVITSIGSGVSQVITTITDSIVRLSNIPTENLGLLGAGLTAVAMGLAAFTGGSFVSSIGGLVTKGINFISGSGSDDIFTKITEFSNKSSQINIVAQSVRNLSSALSEMAKITFTNVSALNDLPWARMTAFALAGGTYPITAQATQKTVSTNNNSIIASDTALVELKAINTNTKALVELSKAMQVIAAAQYEFSTTKIAPVQLKVDGKTLATAQVSYVNNNKGQKSPGK